MKSDYQILWVDDDAAFLESMLSCMESHYAVSVAHSLQEAVLALQQMSVDLVLLDLDLGADNGLSAIRTFRTLAPTAEIAIVSGHNEADKIAKAIQAGAADYICKPVDQSTLHVLVQKMRTLKCIRERHDALVANLNPPETTRQFIGVSTAFQAIVAQADRVRGHTANILIQGESGTGKELLARHIHSLEQSPLRPFIAVNCAAIPEGLIESELFGHEKGAFTGAMRRKLGKFELANGGDIFLDEISMLRLDLQAKILRVLQEKEIIRVGGNHPIGVAFRVIAASNDALDRLVQEHRFRMDLFHRLRVIQIEIPPLRQRREDIPLLITHFLEKHSKGHPKRITAEALQRLQQYEWPGNIRELENVIQSLVILSPTDVIEVATLPRWTFSGTDTTTTNTAHATGTHAATEAREETIDDFPSLRHYLRHVEKRYITHVLKRYAGDKSAAAAALQVGRTTLYSKLKELGLM
ncbi:MAG: sigma-54-dependent Fis family transcriptional regulator [Deltaproteobacteria bacterium]|nr:sigma-54-dependent Fis family transcriptional regulator [Deltaproteobacteria bacterium]